MSFVDTTDNLVKLAVAHLTALGYTNLDVEDNDEDFSDKFVTPPLASPERHWCLAIAGTDSEFAEESGIDVIFIRPEDQGDDQISLRDFDHLDLLVKEGYLRPVQ